MEISKKCSVCGLCGKEFTQAKNLYVHMRKIHEIEPLTLKPTQNFSCNVCDRTFSCQSTLTRHLRKIHKREHDYASTGVTRKVRLICPNESCSKEVLFYDNLCQHLAEEHGIEVECESLTFSSIKEFENWKDEIQLRTFSSYTKDTGSRQLKSGANRIYFNCHRSYSFTSKGNNVRVTKSMGSNKIGKACPSRLAVTINKKASARNEPVVSVKYWKTHCGHELEIGRIPLNKDIRLKIAGKLREGVPINRVLETIRDSECDKDISLRLLKLGRKDIHNIARDFNINYTTKKEAADSTNDFILIEVGNSTNDETVNSSTSNTSSSEKRAKIELETEEDEYIVPEITGVVIPPTARRVGRRTDPDAGRQDSNAVHKGYVCSFCSGAIFGSRYACVQCAEFDLCATCEGRDVHPAHYMLRVPGPRSYSEVQTVLRALRRLLFNQSVIQDLKPGIKKEVEDSMDKSPDQSGELSVEPDKKFSIISEVSIDASKRGGIYKVSSEDKPIHKVGRSNTNAGSRILKRKRGKSRNETRFEIIRRSPISDEEISANTKKVQSKKKEANETPWDERKTVMYCTVDEFTEDVLVECVVEDDTSDEDDEVM